MTKSMRANTRHDTGPERRLRSELHRAGFRFRKHTRPVESLRCTADVIFPRDRVAVFLDGCFWHGCPDHCRIPRLNREYWEEKIARNVHRDRRNDAALAEAGWTVVRCWEHEDTETAVARIVSALRAQRQGGSRPA